MKRTRPRQHVRKLKSGKRVLVNKGVRRRRNDYAYVTGIIKNKQLENKTYANMYDRLQRKLEEGEIKKFEEVDKAEREMSLLKRKIADNNERIDYFNKKYFPRNPR